MAPQQNEPGAVAHDAREKTVSLTQEHIVKGVRNNNRYCPIANALNAQLDGDYRVPGWLAYPVYREKDGAFFELSDNGNEVIEEFDCGRKVDPHVFSLTRIEGCYLLQLKIIDFQRFLVPTSGYSNVFEPAFERMFGGTWRYEHGDFDTDPIMIRLEDKCSPYINDNDMLIIGNAQNWRKVSEKLDIRVMDVTLWK